MEAWLRDRGRPARVPRHVVDLQRRAECDAHHRSPRPGSARGTERGRSDGWEGVPPHGGAGADRGRRSVRRDPRRVRGGGRVRAPSSSVTRSGALARDRGGRRSTRALAARSGHARGPAAREGSRLRGAGHTARRHPGQARARVGRACGQAFRGCPRARAPGRASARAETGRARVRPWRGRAPRCSTAVGRSDRGQGDLGRSEPDPRRTVGLGWIRREPEDAFPDVLRAGRVTARVVPTPFYDPQGDRLRG